MGYVVSSIILTRKSDVIVSFNATASLPGFRLRDCGEEIDKVGSLGARLRMRYIYHPEFMVYARAVLGTSRGSDYIIDSRQGSIEDSHRICNASSEDLASLCSSFSLLWDGIFCGGPNKLSLADGAKQGKTTELYITVWGSAP